MPLPRNIPKRWLPLTRRSPKRSKPSMKQLHLIQLSNLKDRNYETGEISDSIQNAG